MPSVENKEKVRKFGKAATQWRSAYRMTPKGTPREGEDVLLRLGKWEYGDPDERFLVVTFQNGKFLEKRREVLCGEGDCWARLKSPETQAGSRQ